MSTRSAPAAGASAAAPTDPGMADHPVLVRLWRGESVESQHRGAWVVVDSAGAVLEGAGEAARPIFARSSVKSLQALPLIESGAAQRFGFSEVEIALALSSHNAEPCHTAPIAALLERLGLSSADLRCGPQAPGDSRTRAELAARGEKPTALHNNCSGKHAGFLALARHLGEPTASYLDPHSATQRMVRAALEEMTEVRAGESSFAIDGCSAPTFRLPLARLATGIAKLSNPERLPATRRAACERMLRAVAAHPELIAGHRDRLCTEIASITRGRLFPKIGAEGVYVLGWVGGGRALALKIDDGGERALSALVVALLERLGWASASEIAQLEGWRERVLLNRAGLEVGRTEVLL